VGSALFTGASQEGRCWLSLGWRRIAGGTTCRPFGISRRVGWALACPELAEGCPPSCSPSPRFHRRARKQVASPPTVFPGMAQDVPLTASARRSLGRSMTGDGWCSADHRPRQPTTHGARGLSGVRRHASTTALETLSADGSLSFPGSR
jgi:hypothetical protein